MKELFLIQISKDETKNLKHCIEKYKKSGSNSDIYLTLKIDKENTKNFLKKHSKPVDIETCFGIFKLVRFFNIKLYSKFFFTFDQISIDELLLNLSIILQKVQSEEDNSLFDDFLESGNLIQLFSAKILDCFQSKYFSNFNIQRIIKIIENRYKNPTNYIDSDALFSFISKSISDRFVLLRFINFNFLSTNSIKTIDFKQYVINLITQYDECLKSLISLNQDKTQQLKTFNNLCQKGNQIAAFYISSQKVIDNGQPKSGSKYNDNNNQVQSKQVNNFSKSARNINVSQKTSNRKYDDRDDSQQYYDDDFDDDDDDDYDDDDYAGQRASNVKGMSKTMRKSGNDQMSKSIRKIDTKTDDRISQTLRKSDIDLLKIKETAPATTTKKIKKKKKRGKVKKQKSNKTDDATNNKNGNDDKNIEMKNSKQKSKSSFKKDSGTDDDFEEEASEEEDDYDKQETFNMRSSKTLDPNARNSQQQTSKNKPFRTGQYNRPLTAEDKERALIWKETEEIVQKGFYKEPKTSKKFVIKKDVEDSINDTEIISPKHKSKIFVDQTKISKKEREKIKSIVKVVNKSTFEAARILNENDKYDVCVLNFASATKPGGGVKNGRGAQEETLSRMSSLYFSLTADNSMYEFHKKQNDPFYSDYMIFSPDVVVFRDDDYNLIPFYHVSVISSAAVNCQEVKQIYGSSQKVEDRIFETMKNRCRKILLLCLEKDIRCIVLGAFGCGVFKNKPEDISEIFRELIIDEGLGLLFDDIIFAIKSPPKSPNYTLKQFKKAFEY